MTKFLKYFTVTSSKRHFSHASSNKECPPVTLHREGGYKVYKFLTFLVGLPTIFAVAAMTYINRTSEKCPERPDFAPYEYLRRRTKRFPWGDGTKSLFHNPAVNALPEGYEEGTECLEEGVEAEGEEECCEE